MQIDCQLGQADSSLWVQVLGTDIDAPGPLAAPLSGSFDRVNFVLPWGHRDEPFSYLHSTVLSVAVAFWMLMSSEWLHLQKATLDWSPWATEDFSIKSWINSPPRSSQVPPAESKTADLISLVLTRFGSLKTKDELLWLNFEAESVVVRGAPPLCCFILVWRGLDLEVLQNMTFGGDEGWLNNA